MARIACGRRGLLAAGAIVPGLAAAACATVRPPPELAPASAAEAVETLYALSLGWHSDVVLPVLGDAGPLGALERDHPGAHWTAFGFGGRAFFMAAERGSGDYLRALLPGRAAILATPLGAPPAEAFPGAEVVALRVSRAGLDHALRFVADSLDRDVSGAPRPIGPGPYRGSLFYEARRPYALSYTCNTWTADALAVAGLPISAAGVLFSSQVMERARRAAAAPVRRPPS